MSPVASPVAARRLLGFHILRPYQLLFATASLVCGPILAQNSAPVALASALSAIDEDVLSSANTGTAVSSLVSGFTDSDSGAVKGLAITAVDESGGKWFYSTNGGVSWSSLTGVSEGSARLLKGNDQGHRVRFVPNANFFGSATFTYRAWDQTGNSPVSSLSSGLVSFLNFEGSLADQSSQGTHTGTWSVAKSPVLVASAPGNGSGGASSALFDGSTDRIDLANSADLNVNNGVAFSVAAWIKTDFSDGQRVILAKAPASGSSPATKTAALFVSSSGGLRYDNYYISACESAAAVRTGAWVHVAMTYDGTTYRLFVNGTADGSGSFTGSNEAANSWVFTIGQSYNTTFPGGSFKGNIDEVGFWNRALSATEISALATSGVGAPVAAVTTNGGSTAFSANTATATLTVTAVNDAPTLTMVNNLTGATEDTDYTITYAALSAAADAADVDSATLWFRIEGVTSGTLTKNGTAVTAGTTLLGANESLVWRPAADANGTLDAFTVKIWDGYLASANLVQVRVEVAAVNDVPRLFRDGSSALQAASSASEIKNATGTNTNGVYWIMVNGVATQVYCLMDSAIDGGGWMLAMKGANTGSTFSYSSTHWTTFSTLNPGSSYLRRNGSGVNEDAKFDVFNYSAAEKVMAIFPDVPDAQRGGAVSGQTYGFIWIEQMPTPANTATYTGRPAQGSYTGKTLRELFAGGEKIFIREATAASPYRAAGLGVFSTQADVRFFGFNYVSTASNNRARFGFGWNENGGGLYPLGNEGSNDVSGGIGLDRANWSAGDLISCCSNSTGLNRQMQFELYVKGSAISETVATRQVPVAVHSGLSIEDPDSTTLSSATVSITGGFVGSEDSLGYVNAVGHGNIAGNYEAATGVLTLTSSQSQATVAQWQAALRSVTYTNSSSAPNTGNRTVRFAVSDGGLTSSASNVTVKIALNVTYDAKGGSAIAAGTTTTGGSIAASPGSPTRAGYSFAGWALPNTSPIIDPGSFTGLYSRFKATDYNGAAKVWTDSSGNGRHITSSMIGGSPTLTNSAPGNGNSVSFPVVAGGTSSSIRYTTTTLSSYTLFSVARYAGSSRGRIFNGDGQNWLAGFYGGMRGVAHFNSWLSNSSSNVGTVTHWLASTSYPSGGTSYYRADGVERGSGGSYHSLPPLVTNTGTNAEASDYEIAEVLIFERVLSASEIAAVERYIGQTYGLGFANGVVQYPYLHGKSADFTMEAVWNLNSNVVTFDSQGGSAVSSFQWTIGSRLVLPTPTKTGFGLMGWYDAVGGNKVGIGGALYAPANTGPFTLYAQWGAPLLSAVGTLPGAVEDTDFTVTHAMLLAASDATVTGGGTPSFRIEAITSGTLTKNGAAVTAGSTLLGPNESLVWRPAADANGTLNAFTVKAATPDNAAASAVAVQVSVVVAAVNDAPSLASGTYQVQQFNSSGTFTPTTSEKIEALIVGGGGGGAGALGGGGGGGGVVYITAGPVAAGVAYPIVVGAGGSAGSKGQASSAFGAVADGGGTSGSHDSSDGTAGGSGGGAASNNSRLNQGGASSGNSLGANTGFIYGNRGGHMIAVRSGDPTRAAGGGGAGGQGKDTNSNTTGDTGRTGEGSGGVGIANSILGTEYYWAGGGGGGAYTSQVGGYGGLGGGGGAGGNGGAGLGGGGALNSGANGISLNGGAGGANTGGGGGGGAWNGGLGGAGGSGVVIVRFQASVVATRQVPVALLPALTLTDVDSSSVGSAKISITGGYVGSEDVLSYVNAASHGNITGTYDVATGVLTLTSAEAQATLAQWQEALRAVTYTNSSATPNTGSRTMSFVIYDGESASAPVNIPVLIRLKITYDTKGGSSIADGDTTIGGSIAANPGSPTRAGYTFAGWDLAGTPADPASLTGLYSRFKATDYNGTTKVWTDSSGNARNIVSAMIGGSPALITSAVGNGSSANFPAVAGGTSSSIKYTSTTLANYTLFTVARYAGSSRGRIFNGDGQNWLAGFWNGNRGVAHFNSWLVGSTANVGTVTDWLLSTSYPSGGTSYYRADGVLRGTGGSYHILPQLTTNTSEPSDFQIAEVLIYDRALGANEIAEVERYLILTYGLNTARSFVQFPYAHGKSADFTLEAAWTGSSNTVAFDPQGGSAVSSISWTTGSQLTLPSAPSRSGYYFNGWYSSAAGGNRVGAAGATYSPSNTAGFTLYAQWVLPLLGAVNSLTGAYEDTNYTITHAALLAASDASVPNNGIPTFRVDSVSTGTLTKSGVAVTAGSTLLGPNESLVWRPATNANGTLDAFTVRSANSDGSQVSSAAVQVRVDVVAQNDAPTLSIGTTSAVGGTQTSAGGYTIHTFTATGTFTPAGSGVVEVLVVGGGGGGGSDNGGGGGGGGFVANSSVAVTAGTALSVKVGAGGSGAINSSSTGSNGGESSFGNITARGGGGGGSIDKTAGADGGSAGGRAANRSGNAEGPIATTSPSQGNDGGGKNAGGFGGGGGGGAGGAGLNGGSNIGGNGGAGRSSSISGVLTNYAGGGGGGGDSNTAGTGGVGGGGNGSRRGDEAPTPGLDGLGGGGGGAGGSVAGGLGARGGSGIVIVRYPTNGLNASPSYVDTAATDTFANATGTLVGADLDGGTLTYGIQNVTASPNGVATKVGTYGTLAVNTTTGAYTFTPNAAAINALSASTTENFTVTVSDGTSTTSATLPVNITAVNDAPMANAQSVTTSEDTAKAITLIGSDVEGSTLTYVVVTNPANGTLSGTAPNLTYTPTANFNGSDSFTFKVNDGALDSAPATVSITVTAVNDAPTLSIGLSAAGGTKTTVGGYAIHTFTESSGTFTPATSGVVEVLVVGGGGGGGGSYVGGGGGSGGVVASTSYAVKAGEPVSVLVGGGGKGGAYATRGGNGSGSQFGSLLAAGGGGGGVFPGIGTGLDGGSGGGAGWQGGPGAGLSGEGSAGGTFGNTPNNHGGGGGGAGGTPDSSGVGGPGLASAITGATAYYAGGGAAGTDDWVRLNGGLGGGGQGGNGLQGASVNVSPTSGTNGIPNTGGGGGGGGGNSTEPVGGDGGSGIVIVRYLSNVIAYADTLASDTFANATGTLVGADLDGGTLTYGIQNVTASPNGVATKVGTYGTLAVNTTTGAYTFTPNAAAINALSASTTEGFTVTVTDGLVQNPTTSTLTVNVAGANDAPTLSGQFALGFNTDGTATTGWIGVGANDGYNDGKSFSNSTNIVTATGSSALGSQTIKAGTYTVSFAHGLPFSNQAPGTLTVSAEAVADGSTSALSTLGTSAVIALRTDATWTTDSFTFTVAPGSPAIGSYLKLTFNHSVSDVWHGLDSIGVSMAGGVSPEALTLTEDVAGNLTYTGTPFADVDSATLTVTLSVNDGTITGNPAQGITVGGSATARTFSGTTANLNAYFTTAGNITYQGALNNTASRTLTTTVSDGSLSASATSTINFIPVNDAPTLSLGTTSAVGGTQTSEGGYTIHTFTANGTFTTSGTGAVEVLVVAGGGGGGGGGGGAGGAGGGAGGVIYNSSFSVSPSVITVTVGAGGAGGPGNRYDTGGAGSNGSNSVFSTLTAIGGGGGGAREDSAAAGSSGGSGGGGGVSGTPKSGGSGTSGQGYAGGANYPSGPNYGGGGGGGAGAVGQSGSSNKGGDGGIGLQFGITGTATYYGGGGGASYYSSGGSYGAGGSGGGGGAGVAGTANTGGGGGGGKGSSDPGAAGGSGIVIVRYPTNGLNASPSYVDTAALDTFEATTGTLQGADVDAGSAVIYGITGGSVSNGVATKIGTYGTLAVNTTTGAYTFTPNAAAINALSASTTESFTVTVTDGVVQNPTTATLTVNVAGANDAPTLATPAALTYVDTAASDTFASKTGTLVGTDVDTSGSALIYGIANVTASNGVATKSGTYGTLAVATATGSYTFTPNAAAINALSVSTSENFAVTVNDGPSTTAVTLVIDVTAVNDAPKLAPITKSGTEDTAHVFSQSDFASAYSDAEGDPQASIRIDSLPASGTLKLNGVAVAPGQVIPLASLQSAPAGGLVGYWSFDSSSALGRNSVTGESLTNSGGATFLAQGKAGGALSLNGSQWLFSSAGTITGLPVGNDGYSVALWFKADGFGAKGFLGWGNYGASRNVNAFRLDGASRLVNYWWDVDLYGSAQPPLTAGTWYHAVATYDGATRRLYLDGNLIASDTPGSAAVQAMNFGIGKTVGDEYFQGALDEVYIYSRALTSTEVATLGGVGGSGALVYEPAANENGSKTFTVSTSDGKDWSASALVTVNLAAVNDAPVANAQSVTTSEDTAKAITLTGSDVEGSTLTYAVFTSPANGALTGTAPNLTYTPAGNFNGTDSFTFKVNDGGADSAPATVSITVTAVNDAPENTVPGAQTVAEDAALAFTGAAAISVSDVDGNLATTQLTVANGTLTVTLAQGGATISAGANNSATLTLAGTQTQINAALATLGYHGNLNFNGSDTLTVVSTDGANPALSDTDTVSITVTAVNDAPVNTVPLAVQTVNEDTALAFTGAAAISVNDVDGNLATTRLTVANGTLTVTLAQGGATISAGANNSATLTLSGTQAQINAALATLGYHGNLNFNGSDTLTVVSTDGATSALVDTDTVAITVTADNDAPVLAAGRVTLARSETLTVDTNGEVTLTEATPLPAGARVVGVTLNLEYSTYWSWDAVSGCYVKLNGVTFGPLGWTGLGTNNAWVPMERKFSGELPGYNVGGQNTWTFGSAWNPTNLRNVTLTVYYEQAGTPALDLAGTEDTTFTFTAAMFANAFRDVDSAELAGITVTTLPATGTLKLGTSAVVPGQVIAASNLGNLSYEPALNENGAKTFTVTASDGSLSSAAATVRINLAAVNDAPVVAASSGNTVTTEQNPVVVDAGLTVADVDNSTLVSATITVSSGYQAGQDLLGFINAGAQLHGNITGSFNSTAGTLTLASGQASATLAQWQAALRAVTFSNSSSSPNTANRTISFIVNDGALASAAAAKVFVPDYNREPAFTTPPAPVAAFHGTSVFLSAVVSGWPTPALQWRRNGVPIEGATQAVLALHGVIPADAGSYDLVATNLLKTVPSAPVAVTVTARPGELFGAGLSEYGSLGDLSAQGGVARLAKQLWPAGSAEESLQVTAAGRHSLILTSSGKVYGMGHNFVSALGIASNAATYPTPELILDNVRQVAAAQDNSYFLRRDGTLWGVGTTQQGMLGEYYPGAGSTVPFQLVPGQSNIIGVWAGGVAGNGGCIFLTRDGQLFLLGGPSVYAPVRLDTGVMDATQGAGFQLWVKTDGSLWAQGSNTFGQLGTGGTTTATTPQKVADDVARVFAGPSFSFFVKKDASLWAMGRNTFGQLGTGSAATVQSTPARVAEGVSSVACGERHAIFLKADGSVWTMGNNYYGQLGDGASDERRTPVQVASNAVAVAAGSYYSVFVAPVAPTITTQPVDRSLVAGVNATLSVVATGTPALAYQWRKDSADIAGATGSSLALTAVTVAQAGSYVVVVSNGRGAVTSQPAVVSVQSAASAPVIATHPAPQAVKSGANATFAVAANGTEPLGYQWRRNGAILPGATAATLVLPTVQFLQTGFYDVVVTNVAGAASSAPAQLSLLDLLPPQITRDPVAMAVNPGAPVELSVEALGTALRYQWRKDTVEIPGATARTLALVAAGVNDAGQYSVAVFNELGRVVSAAARLSIESVQGQVRVVGSSGLLAGGGTLVLELATSFIGTAPVQLGWTLVLPPGFSYAGGENEPDVKPVAGATGSVEWAYVTLPSGPSAFRVRVAYASGLSGTHLLYGTVAYRTTGLATSATPAPVAVQRIDAPVITRQPVSVSVVAGTPATFSVEAQGGDLSYQWFRNGQSIPGATSRVVAFDPAKGSDTGDIFVRVSNAVASVDSDVARLTVFDVVAEHAVVGPGYVEGQNLEITNTVTYSGGDSLLGWQVLVPAGWTFVSSSSDAGDIRPVADATDLLEWRWTSFPVSPVKFSYTLKAPSGASGRVDLVAMLTFSRSGKSGQALAKPDPLSVERVMWHSADLDRNSAFSLFELLRVIELYNTRRGSVRTGAYRVSVGTEDGFAPEFDRGSGVQALLTNFHTADYGRDGSINLLELLRMIELYNYSVNRARTGEFHRSAGTEDGFAPGPAPGGMVTSSGN